MKNRIIVPQIFNEHHTKANAEFKKRRGLDAFGPYEPLLHSPEVMLDVEAVGRRLRYNSVFPENLKEMAILLVARSMNQPYEWSVHQPIAVKFGVSEATCKAIAEGRRPDDLTTDEALIYNAVTELLTRKNLSDETFNRVQAQYGERGCMELPAILGIYTLLAYCLNVAGTKPDAGAMEFIV